MKDPAKEVVEACITALCGAESQGPREKVLAVIRTYEDLRRQPREPRCPGCGYTEQQWDFRKRRTPVLVCEHPKHWGGPTARGAQAKPYCACSSPGCDLCHGR